MFTRNNPTYKLENISHKRNLLDVKIIGFVSQNPSNFTFFLRLEQLCGLSLKHRGSSDTSTAANYFGGRNLVGTTKVSTDDSMKSKP